jgi:hypothetical protein
LSGSSESGDGGPAERRARLRALRRERKYSPRRMPVSGKSVFLIKRLIEERARRAREAGQGGETGRGELP